jgi:hypothetical protein
MFIGLRGPDVEKPYINDHMTISKLDFQHVYLILFIFFMITSTDLCLCTQLAMSTSPQGLNIEIYLSNFREIITYTWPC